MASSSNTPPHALAQTQEELQYVYALNANVSNFVSVKLSGEGNYHMWETQMICLLESYNLKGIVDDDDVNMIHPRGKQYESLVKGWILGSVSERLLGTVVHLGSAKEVWTTLKSFYSPTMMSSEQVGYAESATMKREGKAITEDKDKDATERNTQDLYAVSAESKTEHQDEVRASAEKRDLTLKKTEHNDERNAKDEDKNLAEQETKDKNNEMWKAIVQENWCLALGRILKDIDMATKAINSDGNTVLHIVVGIGFNELVRILLLLIQDTQLPKMKNSDGSTALHIAAIVGNTEAAAMLINKRRDLLEIADNKTKKPLDKAYEYMHLDTIVYLLKAARDGKSERTCSPVENPPNPGEIIGVNDGKSKDTCSPVEDPPTPIDIIGVKAGKNKNTCSPIEHPDVNDGKAKNTCSPVEDPPNLAEKKGGNDRKNKKDSPLEGSPNPGVDIGANLLVHAISAKQYDLATELVETFPKFAVQDDNVLMALAKTFPSGLDYGEILIYPIVGHVCRKIVRAVKAPFVYLVHFYNTMKYEWDELESQMMLKIMHFVVITLLALPKRMVVWIYFLICALLWVVHFPFFIFYYLLWNGAATVVGPIKHIVKKKREWEKAKHVLKLVCDEIDKSKKDPEQYYKKPILEAARQNAYEVVIEILARSPEAIRHKDNSGYDIIQLAVIHRSEKIYNLTYIIGERKSIYRTIEDSSKSNLLHLAGKLAPSHKLKRRTGAAFQLQRELQWREEVEKIVFPTYITKENIFKETPDMVFTREHENLVKEGEKWMKAVAESCSITAALITTIVFAAAITVPGGSNQNTGIPLFTEDIAFMIFAISDAISLFASSTALLMFLSILTGRFAEQDFLVSLPRRLIIGLCILMLSTTAMMVAFGTTLFLVFCGRKPWMLAPICVSAFLPIASFGTLQIPLIVDLFRSTYIRIFGKQISNNSHIFNLNRLRYYFAK